MGILTDKFNLTIPRERGDNVLFRLMYFSRCDSRFIMVYKVVRCPYCVSGIQFRPMVPRLDGRFVCDECDHMFYPSDASFKCSCHRCGELHFSRIHRDLSPVLKIKPAASQ